MIQTKSAVEYKVVAMKLMGDARKTESNTVLTRLLKFPPPP